MSENGVDWAKAFHQTATIGLLLVLGLVGLQLVSYLADVLTILVSALLVAYVLQLIVDPLSRRMPRILAVLLVVLTVVVGAAAAGALLFPLVMSQINDLVHSLPGALERAQAGAIFLQDRLAERNIKANIQLEEWLAPRLQETSGYITSHVGSFLASSAGGLFYTAMTFVCAFYFLKDGHLLWESFAKLMPPQARRTLDYFRREFDRSLNAYFRGQVINASIVLFASSVVFNLPFVGMTYGIVGALVWGACEVIPMFGTYIGVGICLMLAFLQGGGVVWKVFIAALIIQQIKDNVIAPRVMSHTTGLHPVVVVMAVLTGMKLAGFLGILLAIPLTALALATFKVYFIRQDLAEGPAESGSPPPAASEPVSVPATAHQNLPQDAARLRDPLVPGQ